MKNPFRKMKYFIKATEKQTKRVNQIIDYIGYENIERYIKKYYVEVDMDDLSKEQAQK